MRWRRVWRQFVETRNFFCAAFVDAKKRTVARNIDYGEFRFFFYYINFGAGTWSGVEKIARATSRYHKTTHRRSCLLIFRSPQFIFACIRCGVGRCGEPRWRYAEIHKFSTQRTFLFFLGSRWCFIINVADEKLRSSSASMQLVLEIVLVLIPTVRSTTRVCNKEFFGFARATSARVVKILSRIIKKAQKRTIISDADGI